MFGVGDWTASQTDQPLVVLLIVVSDTDRAICTGHDRFISRRSQGTDEAAINRRRPGSSVTRILFRSQCRLIAPPSSPSRSHGRSSLSAVFDDIDRISGAAVASSPA